jgi:hypothetical protein
VLMAMYNYGDLRYETRAASVRFGVWIMNVNNNVDFVEQENKICDSVYSVTCPGFRD